MERNGESRRPELIRVDPLPLSRRQSQKADSVVTNSARSATPNTDPGAPVGQNRVPLTMSVTQIVAKDQSPRRHKFLGPRVPPNLFAIALGIAGLAQAWHVRLLRTFAMSVPPAGLRSAQHAAAQPEYLCTAVLDGQWSHMPRVAANGRDGVPNPEEAGACPATPRSPAS